MKVMKKRRKGKPVRGPARARPGRVRKESADARQERALAISDLLDRQYPDSHCSLDHRNAFELLVATILSAQCTDARVNLVTKELFRRAPAAEAMARLTPRELEDLIRSTGFYRNKAKSILGAARVLVEKHGGQVPHTMPEMLELPGVARKTANVVLGTAYGLPTGIVVDTHVHRITRLLRLTKQKDPRKVEQDLMALIPEDRWIRFAHQLIDHGRQVCIANRPRCAECVLRSLCPSAKD
jgi:endonuclease-3